MIILSLTIITQCCKVEVTVTVRVTPSWNSHSNWSFPGNEDNYREVMKTLMSPSPFRQLLEGCEEGASLPPSSLKLSTPPQAPPTLAVTLHCWYQPPHHTTLQHNTSAFQPNTSTPQQHTSSSLQCNTSTQRLDTTSLHLNTIIYYTPPTAHQLTPPYILL